MIPPRAIALPGGLELNPHLLEAAQLVERSYAFWSEERFKPWAEARAVSIAWRPWAPVSGWTMTEKTWENLQLMICARPLRPAEDVSPSPEEGLGLLREGLLAGNGAHARARLLVAAVPGTNELADWRSANLNPLPVKVGGLPGRWRRGFVLGGEWVWSRLRAAIEHRDDLLVFAGHSLGGAVAIAAAALALRDGFEDRVAGVLAFGSPRLASGRAADALNRAYPYGVGQRFVLGFDVVPWSVLPLGWHHALQPVFVGSDGVAEPAYRFWREAGRAMRQRGIQAVGHHGMANYLAFAQTLPPAAPRAGWV